MGCKPRCSEQPLASTVDAWGGGGGLGVPPWGDGFAGAFGGDGEGLGGGGEHPQHAGGGSKGSGGLQWPRANSTSKLGRSQRCSHQTFPANPSALGPSVSPSSPMGALRGWGGTGAGGRAAGRSRAGGELRRGAKHLQGSQPPSRSLSLGAILRAPRVLRETHGCTIAGVAAGTRTLSAAELSSQN